MQARGGAENCAMLPSAGWVVSQFSNCITKEHRHKHVIVAPAKNWADYTDSEWYDSALRPARYKGKIKRGDNNKKYKSAKKWRATQCRPGGKRFVRQRGTLTFKSASV